MMDASSNETYIYSIHYHHSITARLSGIPVLGEMLLDSHKCVTGYLLIAAIYCVEVWAWLTAFTQSARSQYCSCYLKPIVYACIRKLLTVVEHRLILHNSGHSP